MPSWTPGEDDYPPVDDTRDESGCGLVFGALVAMVSALMFLAAISAGVEALAGF